MTSTPDTPGPLRNEALEELEKQNPDDLVTPDEVVLRKLTEPVPTDAIGSVDWSDTGERARGEKAHGE